MGITAGYLALILGSTFYLRRRSGARSWRQIHRATVLVYGLAVLHSLGSGTDGGSLWFRLMVIATAVPIVILLATRYGLGIRRPASPARSRPASAAGSQGPA